MECIFVVSKPLEGASQRLLEAAPESPVVLLGDAVLSDPKSLGERPLFCLGPELEENGLDGLAAEAIEALEAEELIEKMTKLKVVNL